jgi:uncharacterized protein YecT (DUF1311 family)
VKSKNVFFSLTFGLVFTLSEFCFAQNTGFEGYTPSYKVCMDKAITTIDIVQCTNDETDKQDKRLNIAYQKLKAEQRPERATQLLDAQRHWLAFRDVNCKFYYDPEGGTLARILTNNCFLTMTRDRALELEQLMMP